MIAASERAWKKIESNPAPRFYFDMRRAKQAGRDGQTPWTPPVSIMFALDVALQRYHEHGMDAQLERHARYARAVRAALQGLGFTIFSRPGAHSDTVVAAYPPEGVQPKALLERLREHYGVVLSGGQAEFAGKIVRFGTMGDVTEADLLGAIGAIELSLADLGSPASGSGTAAAIESLGNCVRVTA
jgi:aspartate aminotransferase-like enzyme